ncbi:MAG: glycine cleavage T C-terminal barrel domain-containing protein [Pseudomonadota bacterium]
MFGIAPSTRLRPSPFYFATVDEGVQNFTTYNHMLMPTGYGDPEAEYWRLIHGVAMWDVAVERQIQITGPDAARLTQVLCPRRMDRCKVGQGKYVALCNHAGTLINDPIVLKMDEQRFWLSIADSNILFWARAIASERKFNVDVQEADVSPLAVQGPLAEDVVSEIFGDWVRDLRYFWFRETEVQGIPVTVARSGWSKQGGFELYLQDGTRGTELWNIVKEAGRRWDIGPGNPNATERVESGLLSWGGDTDDTTNPFEVGLEPYVDLDVDDDVVGIAALRRIKEKGPKRHLLGVMLESEERLDPSFHWLTVFKDGLSVGHMTNVTWSYRLKRTIGFGLVSRTDAEAGDRVVVQSLTELHDAKLVPLPFL